MIDPGETPEQTVRRELQEEADLQVASVENITTFYPSPGGSSEQIYLFYSEGLENRRIKDGNNQHTGGDRMNDDMREDKGKNIS
jgi:8-oxo-dGTP pyrophosphatase MutT (NUDIX family)